MQTITKEEMKKSIEETLNNWMDPEDVEYGKLLSLNFSTDGSSAHALVLYADSSIEIDYVSYSIFSNSSSVSCDKRFTLYDEEYDSTGKEKNEILINTVKEVYEAMIRRFD